MEKWIDVYLSNLTVFSFPWIRGIGLRNLITFICIVIIREKQINESGRLN